MALLLYGCGGKSRPTSSSASAPATTSTAPEKSNAATVPRPSAIATRAELIARANPICRKANAELAATSPAKTSSALVAGVLKNEAIERRAVGELGALKPPKGFASAYRKLLQIRTALADDLGRLAATVKRSSTGSLTSLAKSDLAKSKEQLRRELVLVASLLGFKDCAKLGRH